MLVALGAITHRGFELTLKLIELLSGSTLRIKPVLTEVSQLADLQAKAVQMAASPSRDISLR